MTNTKDLKLEIKKIIEKKLDYIAYIKTETKTEEGKEFFNFKKSF